MADRGKLNPRTFAFTSVAAIITTAVDALGTQSQITIAAGAGNDVHNGKRITIVSGPGAGESKTIINYVSVSGLADVDTPWAVKPTAASRYVLAACLEARSKRFVVSGSAENTVTLAADQGVYQVADWYTQLMVRVVKGTGRGARRIFDNDAARTLNIGTKWDVNPVAGDVVEVEGHLYFPNTSVHIRVGGAASIALQPGGLDAPSLISTAGAGVIWPPAEDPTSLENIEYIELNGAVTWLIQRWE